MTYSFIQVIEYVPCMNVWVGFNKGFRNYIFQRGMFDRINGFTTITRVILASLHCFSIDNIFPSFSNANIALQGASM